MRSQHQDTMCVAHLKPRGLEVVVTTSYLEELGEKHLDSKRLLDYLLRYWVFFKDIRFHIRKVVEIGVASGASLRMWAEFFPNVKIFRIRCGPRLQY